MKRNFFLIIFLLPLLSFVWKPVSYIRNNIKIPHLLVLPPVSVIYEIKKGSNLQTNKELSKQTFYITSNLLKRSIPDSINHEYLNPDSTTLLKINDFITHIHTKINSIKQVKKYILPDSIAKLFNTSKANFVFCTFNGGFIRSKKNLINTHQRNEVTNFLIGVGGRPLESSALMSCFIIDLNEKNILYFERNIWGDRNPTESRFIKLQLTKIISHYFI